MLSFLVTKETLGKGGPVMEVVRWEPFEGLNPFSLREKGRMRGFLCGSLRAEQKRAPKIGCPFTLGKIF
jgi:hypothetical protein